MPSLKSTKFVLTIVALVLLLAGVGAGVLLIRQSAEFREAAAPATAVSILPATQTKAPGQNISFTVQISTGTGDSLNKITNFDLNLSYNPAVLEITAVSRGTLGQSLDQELKKQIDNASGKIAYSAYTLNKNAAIQGEGELVRITGKIKEGASPGSSKLQVASDSKFASLDGQGQNLLSGNFPAEIVVQGGTTTPTPTPAPAGGGAPSGSKPTVDLPSNNTVKAGDTLTGTAAPNSTITITIQSEPIVATVKADSTGKWSYKLPTTLAVGSHTITVTDSTGGSVQKTITIQAAATGGTVATPSPSPAGSATPSPKASVTPKATATPSASPASTSAPIPVSGTSLPTLFALAAGGLVFIFGVFLAVK